MFLLDSKLSVQGHIDVSCLPTFRSNMLAMASLFLYVEKGFTIDTRISTNCLNNS